MSRDSQRGQGLCFYYARRNQALDSEHDREFKPLRSATHADRSFQVAMNELKRRLREKDLRVWERGPTAYSVSSLAHYGLRVLLRSHTARDQDHIQDEYHASKRTDYWKSDATVDDVIWGDDQTIKWLLKDGKLKKGVDRESRDYMLNRLVARVQQHLPNGEGTIAEFGCGSGRNLFLLRQRFPKARLVGFELTESTVERASQHAEALGLNIEFHVADITRPLPWDGKADVSYSLHALEQLPRDFPKALEQMIAHTTGALIFLEPIHELFPRSVLGLAARCRIYVADHLDGFLEYVRNLPHYEVQTAEMLPTMGSPLNPTCEVVLVPSAGRGRGQHGER